MGCYHQQGEEGQVVAAAHSPLILGLCGAALGIPVSCGPQEGKDRGRGSGREEGKGDSLPLLSPTVLWKLVASSFPILGRASRLTFSHIPEYTGEDHILKAESATQERKEAERGERREDRWGHH